MMLRRSMSTAVKNMYNYPMLRMQESSPSVEVPRVASPCKYNFSEIENELKYVHEMLRKVLDNQNKLKQQVDFLNTTTGTVIIGCPSFSFLMYCLMY